MVICDTFHCAVLQYRIIQYAPLVKSGAMSHRKHESQLFWINLTLLRRKVALTYCYNVRISLCDLYLTVFILPIHTVNMMYCYIIFFVIIAEVTSKYVILFQQQ
jgi:hypothetical protein